MKQYYFQTKSETLIEASAYPKHISLSSVMLTIRKSFRKSAHYPIAIHKTYNKKPLIILKSVPGKVTSWIICGE